METKERVRELIDRLPDDCSLEDVLYHLYVMHAVDRGLDDVRRGRLVDHDEVADELRRRWLTGTAG